jgi:hypothetical protein
MTENNSTSAGASAPAALPVAESFAAILSANGLIGEKTIDIPEWGIAVVVRELDVATAIKISESSTDSKGNTNVVDNWVKTVVAGMVRPQIGPAEAEQMHRLNYNAFLRILHAIRGDAKKNGASKT